MTLKDIFPVAVTAVIVIALYYGGQMYTSHLAAIDQAQIEHRTTVTPSPSPFITISPRYVLPTPGQDKG